MFRFYMKQVVIILLSVLAFVTAQSQTLTRHTFAESSPVEPVTVSPLYLQPNASPLNAKKFSIPGERKKKVGSTMTVLGGLLIVGGIVTYASSDPDYYRSTYNQNTNTTTVETIDPKRVLGVLMMVAGTGVAVPGALLWSKGARQYNRYMEEQGQQSLRLGIGTHGAVLSYRF